jgi:hypothetical protein
MGTYDAVFAGVVTWRTAKNTNADLLFGGFFGDAANGALRYIEKELAESD